MKRKVKKLSLNRETLVRLEDIELADAHGAATVKPVICCGMTDSCPPPPTVDQC